MLPPLASPEALSLRLGVTLAGTEADRAGAILDDASALVRSEAGRDWVDDEGALTDVPAVVESVTLAVAYRAFRNPEGLAQASLGDASVSYDRGDGHAAVYLTRDERKAIRRSAGTSAVGAIELASPWAMPADAYPVSVSGGGDPIPLGPFPWETH
ncbi:MAG: hypothetical protein WDA20_14210 [Desulfuromonadales bacterium]